jgi:tetratricopeptide (TPR) repeat protein
MNQRHTHSVILAAAFILALSAGRGITAQQQPTQQPQPQKPANGNEFPGDTTNVPVMPSNGINPAGNASNNSNTAPAPALPPTALPGDDADPVRSPDEPSTNVPTGDSSSSSSLAGLGSVLNPSDDDADNANANPDRRRGRNGAPTQPEHTETAKEDIDVGSYYLSTKNWRAALSRYQSALILDPENPDVYWGLAESQRNLKDYASAKSNYQKLLDYDPDNKHAKDARKALKEPDVANAATQK